jgi:hypothetical protein
MIAFWALCGMASAQTTTTPTVSEFLNAANSVYLIDATPSGMTNFTQGGQAVILNDVADGAIASVFVTAEHQVIIAFQGTTGGLNMLLDPVAALTQTAADVEIVISDDYTGKPPAAFTASLKFARQVVSLAEAQGYTVSNIFITGHSLGGIEAEYVASQTGLGGIAFESTGIADSPASGATGANFVNTVTYGDPVGEFGSDIDAMQPNCPPYVAGGGKAPHYGWILFMGKSSDQTTLRNEIEGNTILNFASDVDFMALLMEFHLPGVQAHDLGVTLNPNSSIVDGIGDMSGPVLKYEDMQIPALLNEAASAGHLIKG